MGRSSIARRRAGAIVLVIAVVGLVWLLLAGGSDPDPGAEEAAQGGEPAAPARKPAPASADLPAEDLVDQLLLVGFEGDDPSGDLTEEIEDRAYGGVLIGQANWDGAARGEKLIDSIRKAGAKGVGMAPLVATIQEGGPYRSLPDLPPEDAAIEIGDRGDPRVAEDWGEDLGKGLAGVGIDLNLGPVADVATLDSPIAGRAFSVDPTVTAELTGAAVRGCEKAGIACAVSHFPGLGAAAQDTDLGPATVGLDPTTLRSRDLPPFLAAIDAGAPAVVVSHSLYSAYDSVSPASLQPEIVTGLLRDELGFDGVAISDDIGAGAIEAVSRPADAAVEAVNAGIDLVQVADPKDVEPVREALLAAVDDGTLSEQRLQEAASRVLALKREVVRNGRSKKAPRRSASPRRPSRG